MRPAGFWVRTYRLAQWLLLPPSFRSRFGRPMRECVAAMLDAAGGLPGRVAAWLRALGDLGGTAWRIRRDRRLPRRLHPGLRRPPRPHIPPVLHMDQLFQDLRFALRSLSRTPGVTAVAVLTLALGIGANSLIFTLVDGVLLEPLPVRGPDRLAALYESNPSRGWTTFATSPANYLDWKEQLRSFDSLTAYYATGRTLTGEAGPQRVRALAVARDYFSTLGIRPDDGRGFTAEEHVQGGTRVVVLSAGLWRGRYGGPEGILGRSILVDGEPHRVVGVFRKPVGIPGAPDLYQPLDMNGEAGSSRGAHYYQVVGRLADGVDLETARRELVDLAARLPLADRGWTATAESLHDAYVGDVRPSLLMLFGAVGLVLLIACANVANLTLVRSARRSRELGIRAALGAGSRRIARLLLTESLLLALTGGALAVVVAVGGLAVVRGTVPGGLPRLEDVGLDGSVVAFTLAVATLTGLIFGVAPARRGQRLELTDSLKGDAPTTAGRPGRLMSGLVVAEVALAVVVVIGAGLLLRSIVALQSVDPGFATEDRITARVGFPRADYPKTADAGRAYEQLLERVQALPGVVSAGAITGLPMGGDFTIGFDIEGRPTEDGDTPSAEMRLVAGDYFGTMGIPVIRGRAFTDADRPETAATVVVNRAFAERFFPDGDALGARIDYGWRRPDEGQRWAEIVGVVGNVRSFGLGNDPVPVYYLSAAQSPVYGMALVTHVEGTPDAAIAGLREALAAVDPDVPLYDVGTLDRVVRGSTVRPRFRTGLLGSFAVLALVLASVGIYGLISTAVAARRREIGVRMAIGASPAGVRRLVVGDGLRLAAAGVAIGTLASLALGRVLAGFLYGVSPHDPLTLGIVVVFLLGVAAAASAVPAARATRVDPAGTLRAE